jgi:hypothetical protein
MSDSGCKGIQLLVDSRETDSENDDSGSGSYYTETSEYDEETSVEDVKPVLKTPSKVTFHKSVKILTHKQRI